MVRGRGGAVGQGGRLQESLQAVGASARRARASVVLFLHGVARGRFARQSAVADSDVFGEVPAGSEDDQGKVIGRAEQGTQACKESHGGSSLGSGASSGVRDLFGIRQAALPGCRIRTGNVSANECRINGDSALPTAVFMARLYGWPRE